MEARFVSPVFYAETTCRGSRIRKRSRCAFGLAEAKNPRTTAPVPLNYVAMRDQTPEEARIGRGSWFQRVAVAIATGFGLGYSPLMPGTVGTVLGLPLAWGMAHLGIAPFVAIELALLAIGVPLCGLAAKALGRRDPSAVVYDEYVTLPVAVFLLPRTWLTLLLAFALHRLFDIAKPWPVSTAERLPGGWGIMADDLIAAALANVVLHALAGLGWI